MARKKTDDRLVAQKLQLSERLRALRIELYGDRGAPELAEKIGIPSRSWYNYEIGVTVPAEVLLRFLDATQAEPRWLLTGEGPKFRVERDAGIAADARGMARPAHSPADEIMAQALRLLSRGEIKIAWKAED